MIRSGVFIENRYEILEKIGTGGMSDVYKARCHKLNRFVAIKFLKPEFCEDKNFVANFKVEAQSAAALLHPNVVNVYDVNETDGIYYIVMEYVDGITLKKYININGKIPVKEATSIAIQVVQGMEAAHNAGIVHRDIKPQNVLISREGKIKVTDFGIARTTTANTLSSDVLGSAQYISPEQARGDSVDARSDIYSFGIVFYEMLTGELPYNGDSAVTIALKHIQEQVPLVSEIAPEVPSSVVRIVEKCTQKKVEKRYQKTSSLLSDLKTSLVNPNDDFVILNTETDSGATVIMSEKEAGTIREEGREPSPRVIVNPPISKKGAKYVPLDEDDEDIVDDSGKKFDKILTICGIAAGVIIVVVLVLIFVTNIFGKGCGGCSGFSSGGNNTEATTTQETTAEVKKVKMPAVVGKKLSEAEKELDKLNIKYTVTSENSDKEKNTVIAQSIQINTEIDEGTTVELTISAGKDTVKLTDLSDLTQKAAENKLTSMGLKFSVKNEYSDSVEAGKVISTNPGKNSEVDKGGKVELIVSLGPEIKTATVPNCIGSSEEDARSMCEVAGLTVTVEKVATVNKSNNGKVLNQSLSAGDSVEEGSEIVISVGEYEETTTEPTTQSPTEPTTEQPTSDKTSETSTDDTTDANSTDN